MTDQRGRMGEVLRFRMEIDRPYIPAIVDALLSVEAAGPMLGHAQPPLWLRV
jgi:hypothetical protein